MREKERERNMNVWLPLTHPATGELTRNPSMCPDWELNLRLFDSQADTQSTEPHQLGLIVLWNFISLIGRQVEDLFKHLLAICMKCLFRSSAHLLNLDCLVLSCMSSLYILDINPLSAVCRYLLPFSCLFILLDLHLP